MNRTDHLPKDRRGLPIPVIVQRDAEGKPHFTINDAEMVNQIYANDGCHICGGRLGAHKWFIGGPGSAFHPSGRYFDGPVHKECGEVALKLCPHLSLAGKYKRPIEGRGYTDGAVLVDQTVSPGQPAAFVFADTARYRRDLRTGHFIPERPWRQVEFWRGGSVITEPVARSLVVDDPVLPCSFAELVWWPR